jgi:hypothetical protein
VIVGLAHVQIVGLAHVQIVGLAHVQIAAPAGCEDDERFALRHPRRYSP